MKKHKGNPSLHYCHHQNCLYFRECSFPSPGGHRPLCADLGVKTYKKDERGELEAAALRPALKMSAVRSMGLCFSWVQTPVIRLWGRGWPYLEHFQAHLTLDKPWCFLRFSLGAGLNSENWLSKQLRSQGPLMLECGRSLLWLCLEEPCIKGMRQATHRTDYRGSDHQQWDGFGSWGYESLIWMPGRAQGWTSTAQIYRMCL